MQIMVALPVLFKGKALRGDGIKTMLTFVPTSLEIPDIESDDAPLVAVMPERHGSGRSEYRLVDGDLYGSLVRGKGHGIDDGSEIIRRIHMAVGKMVASRLEGIRIDDLYPKDAKDLMALLSTHEGYHEYLVRITDRIAARNMDAVTQNNPDFEAARQYSLGIADGEAARFVMVDGQRFQRTVGLNIKVESHYNNTIEITEEEPWNGSNWTQRPHEVRSNTANSRTRYFGIADRDEARRYAEELGDRLEQRVFDRTGRLDLFVPAESLPTVDWCYADLVRSATMVARFVGVEVARRIRNREESIFTDDPTLRYACDRLLDALRDADPFGEPDDRIEFEAKALLSYIRANTVELDARYRDFATSYKDSFEHLETSLERFENRDVEFVLETGPKIGRPGL